MNKFKVFDKISQNEKKELVTVDDDIDNSLDDVILSYERLLDDLNVYEKGMNLKSMSDTYKYCDETVKKIPHVSIDSIKIFAEDETNLFNGIGTVKGTYISALWNRFAKEDDEIVLDMKNQDEIYGLAYRMEQGKMTVITEETGNLGFHMSGGELIINGNALRPGYFMAGGKIAIKGDAKEIGQYMRDGEILVMGNVSRAIGKGKFGGKITVFGNKGKGVY